MKLILPKLKSLSALTRNSRDERKDLARSMTSTRISNVNQEYKAALRTDSYVEMCTRVQGQLKNSDGNNERRASSSIRETYIAHLSKTLLEPGQEDLINMIRSSNFHPFLIHYFEASSEACDICELLLRGVHQSRINYKRIKRVIKLTKKRVYDDTNFTNDQCHMICNELAAFSCLANPLSIISRMKFSAIHDEFLMLLREFNLKHKKIRRRRKLLGFCKKLGGCTIIISSCAIAIASLVIAVHTMVGIVMAPGIMACILGLWDTSAKSLFRGPDNRRSCSKRFGSQLDVAAKCLFILINDMSTIGSLVARLEDEIEHTRSRANMVNKSDNCEILKEVVKELDVHSMCFLEQLEELEELIYLCLLTINRSRRFVIEEIMISR